LAVGLHTRGRDEWNAPRSRLVRTAGIGYHQMVQVCEHKEVRITLDSPVIAVTTLLCSSFLVGIGADATSSSSPIRPLPPPFLSHHSNFDTPATHLRADTMASDWQPNDDLAASEDDDSDNDELQALLLLPARALGDQPGRLIHSWLPGHGVYRSPARSRVLRC
jgi:hypothetical protein